MTPNENSLHWTGKTVSITGHSFKVSDELQVALSEMLDAANSHDADRIQTAIDKYEALSNKEDAQ